jgi:hypothetical protein
VVLQNNGQENLTVSTNRDFTFPTPLDDGSAYAVTVVDQPDTPRQICSISNDAGFVSGSNITNVSVVCETLFALSLLPPGEGSVSSSPVGIHCPSACDADFVAATEVSLAATPNPDWTTGSWTWFGDCTGGGACVLNMDADKSVEVEFQCDLIILETLLPISTAIAPWECDVLETTGGFELEGPAASVTFNAASAIGLGSGFRVGPGAVFRTTVGQ